MYNPVAAEKSLSLFIINFIKPRSPLTNIIISSPKKRLMILNFSHLGWKLKLGLEFKPYKIL